MTACLLAYRVSVEVTLGHVGKTSFTFAYRLLNDKKKVVGTARTVHVTVDKKTKKKIGQALIQVMELDPNEFSEKDGSTENIKEETLIRPDPKHFLSLHDYQKQLSARLWGDHQT